MCHDWVDLRRPRASEPDAAVLSDPNCRCFGRDGHRARGDRVFLSLTADSRLERTHEQVYMASNSQHRSSDVPSMSRPRYLMLFASVLLTDETWRPLLQGLLMGVPGGELVSVS